MNEFSRNLIEVYRTKPVTRRASGLLVGGMSVALLLACSGKIPDLELTFKDPNDPTNGSGAIKFPEGYFNQRPDFNGDKILKNLDFRLWVSINKRGSGLIYESEIGRPSRKTHFGGGVMAIANVDFTKSHVFEMGWSNKGDKFTIDWESFNGVKKYSAPMSTPAFLKT